jgi:hypothetical protein
MDGLIRSLGRLPQQRTTLYGGAPAHISARSYDAAPLAPLVTGQRAARRGRALSGTA